MRRGEVWIASFRPARGQEVGKARPCVILQADWLTERGCETVVALPLTTQLRPGSEALRPRLPARDRLQRDCFVMVEKPRALDRRRFSEGPLTALSSEEMSTVEHALLASLGFAPRG